MYGITINGKHTYTNYGMKAEPYSFSEPQAKRYKIDIDGADGQIDLTNVLGSIKYENSVKEFIFDKWIDIDEFETWKSQIVNDLQGQKVNYIMDNDLDYYRIGDVELSFSHNGMNYCEISMEIDTEPYKLKVIPTEIDVVSTTETTQIVQNLRKSVIPEIITNDADMEISINGSAFYGILTGGYYRRELFLVGGENSVIIRGNGTVKLKFTEGVLG